MKKLTLKSFWRWAKKNRLTKQKLRDVLVDLEAGKSTVSLGKNLYKVRVNKNDKGKSGGYRTLIIYKKDFRAIFVHGFGKNERDNLDEDEERDFKELGKTLLQFTSKDVDKLIRTGDLINIEEAA